MISQLLSHVGALTGEAKLWVFPQPERSQWLKKLDWYMEFQVARASIHKQIEFPPALLELAAHYEVDPPKIRVLPEAPLLVATTDLLPTHKTVVIPYKDEPVQWLNQIFGLWERLMKPRLRIFLPTQVNVHDVQLYCFEQDRSETVALVPDR